MPRSILSASVIVFALFCIVLYPARAGNSIELKNVYSQPKKPAGDLDYLKKYAGKYPHDVHLLTGPALAKRLKKLLGNRYAFVQKTWAVETPMQVEGNVFSASGCQQHNCADTNFIIAVDFSNNVLYAGIREETKVKLYAEDGSTNKQVTAWANGWDNRK